LRPSEAATPVAAFDPGSPLRKPAGAASAMQEVSERGGIMARIEWYPRGQSQFVCSAFGSSVLALRSP
jgi:hypothetical protein